MGIAALVQPYIVADLGLIQILLPGDVGEFMAKDRQQLLFCQKIQQ